MRKQVVIVGAGPSGLLLGRLLDLAGIDNIVLERQTQDYVLARIRAGILEQTTVDLIHRAGAGTRLDAEGIRHHAVHLAFDYKSIPIGLSEHTNGKVVTAYGQTEVTRDLCSVRDAAGSTTIYEAANVEIHDFDGDSPYVTFEKDGTTHRVDCDLIAGCDGYHGVCRQSVPSSAITTFEKIYPFGWLGLLSDTKPVAEEVVYANTARGFALCSMRSMTGRATTSSVMRMIRLKTGVMTLSGMNSACACRRTWPRRWKRALPSKRVSHHCAVLWPSLCDLAG